MDIKEPAIGEEFPAEGTASAKVLRVSIGDYFQNFYSSSSVSSSSLFHINGMGLT